MSQHRAQPGASRIMVVDDDLMLGAGLKDALERKGHLVLVVDRGSKAAEAAARFRPDLVLLDVMMPDVDGWETLARLRAHASTNAVPVIMLTAAGTEAAKVRGFTLGADDYITKPFSLQELHCRIDAVLRRTSGPVAEDEVDTVPVVGGRSGFELVRVSDIYFIEGVRNYTNVHTFDAHSLCRLTLGQLEERNLPGLMRVQRSYIVNLNHVRGCGWATKSSYRLRLSDLPGTTITVSRTLIPEVQRRLGLRT